MEKIIIFIFIVLLIVPQISPLNTPIDTLNGNEKDAAIAKENSKELTKNIIDKIKFIGGYVSPSKPFQGILIILVIITLLIIVYFRYISHIGEFIRFKKRPKRREYIIDM